MRIRRLILACWIGLCSPSVFAQLHTGPAFQFSDFAWKWLDNRRNSNSTPSVSAGWQLAQQRNKFWTIGTSAYAGKLFNNGFNAPKYSPSEWLQLNLFAQLNPFAAFSKPGNRWTPAVHCGYGFNYIPGMKKIGYSRLGTQLNVGWTNRFRIKNMFPFFNAILGQRLGADFRTSINLQAGVMFPVK